ncbi:MAG: hypothetical protein V1792_14280 [Pseudomonadota bacterium]
MMIKRILTWSVLMVMACVATVPVAGAEQPIIIPVILVVSQDTNLPNPAAPLKLQAAVYSIRAADKQPPATLPSLPQAAGTERAERDEVRLDDCSVHRVDVVSLIHGKADASGSMEVSLPMLLKMTIRGGEAAVSISCGPHGSGRQWTDRQGPVIPATDLLTGRPTTVRPEYTEEYHRIVGSNTR